MSQQDPFVDNLPQTKLSTGKEKAPSFMVPIFKLPIILYRLRLGWLLGKRFMQITHVGRQSMGKCAGLSWQFCASTGKPGRSTQFRPGREVTGTTISSPRLPCKWRPGLSIMLRQQRTLSPEEITTAFMEYRKQHPIFSRMICRIPGWKSDSTYEEFLALARTLHGVAFSPK